MKKLGKLSINLNKVIKNEELVNLRGGYDDFLWSFDCYCYGGTGEHFTITATSHEDLVDALAHACGNDGIYCTQC